MKKLFTSVMVLNLLIEWFAAATLIGAPETMFAAGDVVAAMWARIYGFAAFAIGSAVLWTWKYRNDLEAVSVVLGILCTFHVSVLTALATSEGQAAGTIIHAVMSVLFVVLYASRNRWCAE